MTALNGHTTVAKLLIDAGTKITIKNDRGNTAAQLSRSGKHTDIENLITALPNKLLAASKKNNLPLIKLLIKQNVDINHYNTSGYTALHLAAQHGHLTVVQFLIDHGANLYAYTSFFNRIIPLDLAIKHKKTATRNLLLFEMIKTGQKWALDNYIGFKLDLNQQDHHGKTLLHWAIINDEPFIMNKLLTMNDIDLMIRDNVGNTPNHYAIEKEMPSLNKRIMTQSIANCFSNIVGLNTQIKTIEPTCQYLSDIVKNAHLKNIAFHALLLYGPRGTGKTMTAKSLAREAACEFVELKLKTRSLENIKKAYNTAFAKAPSILFIDEIDQVAARDKDTKNLLIELIKQETDAPIVFVGTTNWLEKLDKDLLKAFERVAQIQVPLPTLTSKKVLLKRFIKSYIHGIDFNETLDPFINEYTLKTRSKSGRELKQLVIQACRNAQTRTAKKGIKSPKVTKADLWKALQEQDPTKNMLIESINRRLNNYTVNDLLITKYSEKLENMGQPNIELFVQKIKYRIDNSQSDSTTSSTQTIDIQHYFEQAFREITKQLDDENDPTATTQEIHHHTHTTINDTMPSSSTPAGSLLATTALFSQFKIDYNELKFEKLLGEGSYGKVYKVRWGQTDVAVKKLLTINKNNEQLFKQEAKIWSQLHHPHIVQLFGICIPPNPFCMIMAYHKHGSLYDLLKSDETLSWTAKRQLSTDIVSALIYLHKRNILHRDLKSLNVLVSKQEGIYRATLSDFGLSIFNKRTTDTQHKPTGSILWMAPELLKGKQCTKKSDIYAYGLILLELATRTIPFTGTKKTLIPTLIKQGHIPNIPSSTPKNIATTIAYCCSYQPEERPIAGQLIALLQDSQTPSASNNSSYSISSNNLSTQSHTDATDTSLLNS